VSDSGRFAELRLSDGADAQAVLREAVAKVRVSRFEIVEPSLHEIFVSKVSEKDPPGGLSSPGQGATA